MAKLNCECGYTIHFTGHSKYEFYLLSTNYMDELTERSDEKPLTGDELRTALIEGTQKTLYCEECRRLYIYGSENGEQVIRVYAHEETIPVKRYDDKAEQ